MAIAALKSKGLKPNKQTGFTLVELIVVVGLISMIAIYITIEINQSSDDAKVGIVTAFLVSNVPNAIASYRARNLGTCKDLDAAPTTGDSSLSGLSGDEAVKAHLVLRGLSPNTPWGEEWSAKYNTADGGGEALTVTITYPIGGANSDDMKSSIVANIQDQGKVMDVDGDGSDNDIAVTYNCS